MENSDSFIYCLAELLEQQQIGFDCAVCHMLLQSSTNKECDRVDIDMLLLFH